MQLGNNAGLTQLYSNVALTVTSDARYKRDIEDCAIGLSFVTQLQPKKFHLRSDPEDKTTKRFGFIAQEVADLIQSTDNSDFGVVGYDSELDKYSLSYNEFIAPMTLAIKELKNIVDTQQNLIRSLEERIARNADLEKK
jgi:hypothetical protein